MEQTNLMNLVTGQLKVDPDRTDPTKFGLYATGTVQLYPYGTRHNIDERSFVYGHATAICNPGYGAAFVRKYLGGGGASAADALTSASAQIIGDTQITIALTSKVFAKDELIGGYYSQPDGTNKQFRRIIANTAGAVTTLTLEGPLTRNLVANSFAEIMQNPWADMHGGLVSGNATFVTFGGVPVTYLAAGNNGWFQTWGPTWVTPETPPADTANWRTLVFQGNGSIRGYNDAQGEDGHQVAGYVIDATASGATGDNPPFVFLTISR